MFIVSGSAAAGERPPIGRLGPGHSTATKIESEGNSTASFTG